MKRDQESAVELIANGRAVVGIEFGSTRIKAALISPSAERLAGGSHTWENQLDQGIWTYALPDVFAGLAACYASLTADVSERFGVPLRSLAGLGVSGMMHGYLALDAQGELLVPFRTWRNNITAQACAELTPLLDFAVPQRWSIAHLYQSILESQPHVPRIAHLTTLAGYVHYRLTGELVLGIGEASGMFPIDAHTGDWDRGRLSRFEQLIAPRNLGFRLTDILPRVLPAGAEAGRLTAAGAQLLDPTGGLETGALLCPPEGDAGTGMVATNAVRPRSGNVSAGTSVFAMVVLERPLSAVHDELDVVATPDGKPVAMAHANNGSSDLDAWIALFGQVAEALGIQASPGDLYEKLLPLALRGDADAGGLLSINYVSGEHVTGFSEGRPLFVRNQDAKFTLPNFVRALCFSSLCAVRAGMNILTEREGVVIDELRGHGGFFKVGDVGQRMMAAALGVPVSVPSAAGEGGAWGMALLAAYALESDGRLALADYLDARISGSVGRPVAPDPEDVRGFAEFFARHGRGLAIEREAIKALG
ncbi:MAG TPA: FGGY-family carbohydrate kinase [Polyangiaceae bacterium]